MAIDRTPLSEAPELDDVNRQSGDGLLMWLLKPYVWLHGLVTLPFRYRRTSIGNRSIGWQPLTTEQAAVLSPSVQEYLRSTEAGAERVGFREAVRFGDASRRDREGTITITVSPSTASEDLCIAAVAQVPRRFTMTGVTFHTRMTDGLLLATGNERRVAPSSGHPSHDVVTFPQIVDVGELYEIHRQRKARAMRAGHVPQAVGWHPPAIHPLQLYQRLFDEGIDEALRRGRVEAPATEEIRLTLKGAALSAWGNAWPFDQLSDWREVRRSARVLRALGLK
jgi:hypothetical protein